MSITLSGKTLSALCTHFRNLGKAPEVLGCSKTRNPTASVVVSLEHVNGARMLVLKGSDGSTMTSPLLGVDAANAPAGLLSLLAGCQTSSPAQDDIRAALVAEYADHDATRAQLAAVTAKLEALAKAKPVPAVAPIVQRLQEAKAEHGSLLDAIVAETAKPAQVAQASAVAVKVAPAVRTDVETLVELEGRADVEIESRSGRPFRVTFKPRGEGRAVQGVGVADSLKARGFAYSGKLSVGGRLVWER